MDYAVIISIILFLNCEATPIDNGVEGDPEIECGANSVTINFNVRNDFQGHVYVKGRFAEAGDCRTEGSGRRVAGIKLAFENCGTKRERSLSPKGVFVSNTVVISFHPQFLTKVDRAYTVQCFYMEADKTVSQDLEVSDITTALQTQAAVMPICRYEILEGGPSGQPVKFAIIGQQVYHKWTCDTETVDMFCALIHSCSVDDGSGNNVQLLNEQGCALDKYLLGNLEYPTDLTAGHEAHVFKYADKAALFFNCQISILGKEPGQPCNRPQCPEPAGLGQGNAPSGSAAPQPPRATSPHPAGSSPGPISSRPLGGFSPSAVPRPPGANPTLGSSPRPRGSTPLAPAPIATNALAAALRRDANPSRNFRFRYAREAASDKNITKPQSDPLELIGTWDVAANSISALDIGLEEDSLPSSLRRHQNIGIDTEDKNRSLLIEAIDPSVQRYCIRPSAFAVLTVLTIIFVLSTSTIVLILWIKKYKNP